MKTSTRIDEIGDSIYRISTPVPPSVAPGGFSFNQILLVDEDPLLFHTGSAKLFPDVKTAIEKVLPLSKLRYIGFSHYEQDECGSLNAFLACAPNAEPLCGQINAMINSDGFDRPPRVLEDAEELKIGKRTLVWYDTPHLPHGWECGYVFEKTTKTLFCGDLFTQPGTGDIALTSGDILGPSEKMRSGLDYFSHGRDGRKQLERLAALRPNLLACMHGSAFSGDGHSLLLGLAEALEAPRT